MPSTRPQTCVRLSDDARRLITLLERRLGLNVTGVLEIAIREAAEKRGISLSDTDGNDA